jgi:MFS family permease
MIREWMGSSLVGYYGKYICKHRALKDGKLTEISAAVILSSITEPKYVSLISGVLTTFMALGTMPLIWTIERVGRRTVLLYTAIVMTLLLTVYIVLVALSASSAMQWAAVGILFAFMFTMGYGWQGAVWLYGSEIAPLEYRHIGGAATAAGEWLSEYYPGTDRHKTLH